MAEAAKALSRAQRPQSFPRIAASEMLLGWQAAVCGLPPEAWRSPPWREGWWLCRARTSKR